ncbi:hypothetical protein SAY87_002372 [Trapa incisa]|uniref:Carbohydrate kinase FGGY C-terminal domain-containing protein n=1 Tax=Trapa incisa TaxID=236973 RepID=A0AAN7JZL7_9MYRT|nr:hypothetical protein SAY87_002372 [Trapa incisa]
MCFQVRGVLDSMHKDAKGKEKNENGEFLLRLDGGATVNNLLMQTQIYWGSPVVRPAYIETTALGAAYAAGLAAGIWTEDDIFNSNEKIKDARIFHLAIAMELRKKKLKSWAKAIERTFGLADLSL